MNKSEIFFKIYTKQTLFLACLTKTDTVLNNFIILFVVLNSWLWNYFNVFKFYYWLFIFISSYLFAWTFTYHLCNISLEIITNDIPTFSEKARLVTNKLRSQRHHKIRSLNIAESLRKEGYAVYEEVLGITYQGWTRRANILAKNRKTNSKV